jgi:hypothetical protein
VTSKPAFNNLSGGEQNEKSIRTDPDDNLDPDWMPKGTFQSGGSKR